MNVIILTQTLLAGKRITRVFRDLIVFTLVLRSLVRTQSSCRQEKTLVSRILYFQGGSGVTNPVGLSLGILKENARVVQSPSPRPKIGNKSEQIPHCPQGGTPGGHW